jgi:hypothetical protein
MEVVLHKRFVFTEKGIISDTGLRDIANLLASQGGEEYVGRPVMPLLPYDFDWTWVTRRGKLPKRIANFYYRTHAIKLPSGLVSQIGNLGHQHTSTGKTFHFQFVDRIDWEAGDFDDYGSCLFSYNSDGLDAMIENGTWAICFYEGDTYDGMGRAWLYNTGDFWIVWNAYGYETREVARMLAQFWGVGYERIALRNNGSSDGQVYINSGAGFAVGPHSVIRNVNRFDFEWDVPYSYECEGCGDGMTEDEQYLGPDYQSLCWECFHEVAEQCNYCSEAFYKDGVKWVGDYPYCLRCLDRKFSYCESCEEYYRNDQTACPSCPEETEGGETP